MSECCKARHDGCRGTRVANRSTLRAVQVVDPALSQCDLGLYKQITGEDPTDLKKWVSKYSGAFQSIEIDNWLLD